MSETTQRNAKVIALAIAVVVLGVWVYEVYEKRTTREAALFAIVDAADRLRTALSAPADAAPDFARDAAAVDGRLLALRRRDTSAIQPLADAVDDYLVTAREILRRQAAMRGSASQLSEKLDVLMHHVQSDRGQPDWTRKAVSLRAEVDPVLREYRIATESYVSLLDSLPQSQAKVAPYADSALLLEPAAVKSARQRALDALAHSEENVRRATRLR